MSLQVVNITAHYQVKTFSDNYKFDKETSFVCVPSDADDIAQSALDDLNEQALEENEKAIAVGVDVDMNPVSAYPVSWCMENLTLEDFVKVLKETIKEV